MVALAARGSFIVWERYPDQAKENELRFPDAIIWRLPAGLHDFKRKTLVKSRAHLLMLR